MSKVMDDADGEGMPAAVEEARSELAEALAAFERVNARDAAILRALADVETAEKVKEGQKGASPFLCSREAERPTYEQQMAMIREIRAEHAPLLERLKDV